MVDSSTLISLARAGLLGALSRLPVEPVILDVVWDEVVIAGRLGHHADAVAVERALGGRPLRPAEVASTVDEAVLVAARDDGILLCNDLTLGRRAATSAPVGSAPLTCWCSSCDEDRRAHRKPSVGSKHSSPAGASATSCVTNTWRY